MLRHRLGNLERSQMQPGRQVRLFRNGGNQSLRIPRDMELDADEATIRRIGVA
jgi:antitoxin VapB